MFLLFSWPHPLPPTLFAEDSAAPWLSLFDGKSLDGWKASET